MSVDIAKLLAEALRHHQSGRLAEAEPLYRQILAEDSRHPDALHLLGVIAHQVGKNEIAVALMSQAIGVNSANPSYHCNLGTALQALARVEEALSCYDSAVRLQPDFADAHSNRGNILRDLGRPEEALAAYASALQFKPNHAEAHANRGNALRELHRFTEAVAAYDAALRITPDLAEAHSNRAAVLTTLGYFAEPTLGYEAALQIKPHFVDAHSNLILDLHYGSDVDNAVIEAATRRFADLYRPLSPSLLNAPDPDRRLRIGYVSGDFCRHSVSYFLAVVLENHHRDSVEIFCYPTRIHQDDMTARLRSSADHWRSFAGLSDDAAAELVRSDKIDLLVDLSGHTAYNRLRVFAHKAAPVQVTWLGFPGTTGLAAMDYRLVDEITDPEGDSGAWTSETLVRLPNGFLCFDPPRDAPDVAPPPCLDQGVLTFGSFNNPSKLCLATLDVWAALLARLPESRLLLKGRPFEDETARALLLQRLQSRGVAPDRVSLLAWASDPAGHLGLYRQIDIALDPFPYNGTTTTCEALWMGVPVVTLKGTRHSGRVGASLLTRLGLQELIAADPEDYVRIAADVAVDRQRLSQLRGSLRQRMRNSLLCDGPAFTQDLEAAFRAMWRNWCAKAAADELT